MVSSQVLENMVSNLKCSENEMNDIANAVNDGVDCIILGKETSVSQNAEKAII